MQMVSVQIHNARTPPNLFFSTNLFVWEEVGEGTPFLLLARRFPPSFAKTCLSCNPEYSHQPIRLLRRAKGRIGTLSETCESFYG